MWGILNSEGFFWKTHALMSSAFAFTLIIMYIKARNVFKKVPRKSSKMIEENQSYIFLGFAHLLCQFIYSFLYDFSFLTYLARTIFFIQIFTINYSYIGFLPSESKRKAVIDLLFKVLILLSFGLFFISIIKIRSSNQCGQIYSQVYLAWYGVAGSISVINCIRNLLYWRSKEWELDKEASSITSNQDSFERKNISEDSPLVIQYFIRFYKLFFIVSVISCYLGGCMIRMEVVSYYQNENMCADIFKEMNVLLAVVFSAVKIISTNSLNILIIKNYYWDVKERLLKIISEETAKPRNYNSFLKENHKKVLDNFKIQMIKEENSSNSDFN
jgi:hypothetical protein